jgi:hypothetical protein
MREMKDDATDGRTLETVSTVEYSPGDWADGWDKYSLLSFYSSHGGNVTEMAEALADERGFEGMNQALGLAAKAKDQAVGTERWRTRF